MDKRRETPLSTVLSSVSLSPSLFHTHTHTLNHTSKVRLADGRLVKGGRRGPDVTETTVQKAKGFDLPYHRGTTVGEERMLTGPLKEEGKKRVKWSECVCL